MAQEGLRELVAKWKDDVANAPQAGGGPHRAIGALNRYQRKMLERCTDELEQALSACNCDDTLHKNIPCPVHSAALAPSPLTEERMHNILTECPISMGNENYCKYLVRRINAFLASPAEQPKSWLEKQRKKVPLSNYSGPAEQPGAPAPAGEEPSHE